MFNNIVLSVAAGEVLLGTLYPLFVDALGLGKISVGPVYFNTVIVPLAVPMFIVMGVGPLLSWKRGDLKGALSRLKFALGAAIAAVLATLIFAGMASRSLWASLGFGLGVWLLASALTELSGRVRLFQVPFAETLRRAIRLPRSAYGMTISHMGLALVLIGVTGSLAWQTERLQTMSSWPERFHSGL